MQNRELVSLALERGLVVKPGKKHQKVYSSTSLVCVVPYGRKVNPRNAKMAELAIRKASV
jgi:hypothetical protein